MIDQHYVRLYFASKHRRVQQEPITTLVGILARGHFCYPRSYATPLRLTFCLYPRHVEYWTSPWPSGLKRWNQTLVPVVRARFEPQCGRPHFAPTRSAVCVCGRNRTEAREREWAEGTVSSLPGT